MHYVKNTLSSNYYNVVTSLFVNLLDFVINYIYVGFGKTNSIVDWLQSTISDRLVPIMLARYLQMASIQYQTQQDFQRNLLKLWTLSLITLENYCKSSDLQFQAWCRCRIVKSHTYKNDPGAVYIVVKCSNGHFPAGTVYITSLVLPKEFPAH